MLRQRGRRALVGGAALHWAYHLYASTTFAVMAARVAVGGAVARRPAGRPAEVGE